MNLSDLAKAIQPTGWLGPTLDPKITQIVADSRAATEGALFIAISGEKRDGHDFIDEAVRRGARAVIAEHPPRFAEVPVLIVGDTRRALAQLAATYFADPAEQLDLFAVTGTVGKTSTSLILQHILQTSGRDVGVIGSLGIRNGAADRASSFTTPDPLTLQKAFKEMRSNQIDAVVMEVSSHALAQERTFGLNFEHVTMTNLLPLEHLEYHPTFEHYVQTKARILDQINDTGVVIYNFDDPNLGRFAKKFDGRRVSFGFHDGADVRVERWKCGADGSTFDLCICPHVLGRASESEKLPSLHIPLLGQSNVTNAVAAIATALSQGMDPHHIRTALTRLRPFKRRMERLEVDGITVIDDTAGHPRSFEQLFTCIRGLDLPPAKLVIALRGGRGPDINVANAAIIADWYRRLPVGSLWITSSIDVVEDKDRVTPQEKKAYLRVLEAARVPYVFHSSLEETVNKVAQSVTAGDFLILAGAQGMDQGARFIRRHLSRAQPLYQR